MPPSNGVASEPFDEGSTLSTAAHVRYCGCVTRRGTLFHARLKKVARTLLRGQAASYRGRFVPSAKTLTHMERVGKNDKAGAMSVPGAPPPDRPEEWSTKYWRFGGVLPVQQANAPIGSVAGRRQGAVGGDGRALASVRYRTWLRRCRSRRRTRRLPLPLPSPSPMALPKAERIAPTPPAASVYTPSSRRRLDADQAQAIAPRYVELERPWIEAFWPASVAIDERRTEVLLPALEAEFGSYRNAEPFASWFRAVEAGQASVFIDARRDRQIANVVKMLMQGHSMAIRRAVEFG